jgi:hypothetical protein
MPNYSGSWTLQQQMQAQAASNWPFGGPFNYVDDVFSTYLYTGTGASQTITNGIDLAGKGGLLWIKSRTSSSASLGHVLADTVRGRGSYLASQSTNAAVTSPAGFDISSFNSDGFTLNDPNGPNNFSLTNASSNYCSWTFREQPKFFDVVAWTGNGANRTIAHNLGSVPGMIIVKQTNAAGQNWIVWHRSIANTQFLMLNRTDAVGTYNVWNNTTPTSTVFSVSDDAAVNGSGDTYVAYLFAHDAGGFGAAGTDNVISCGSFTNSGSDFSVSLGYEPQYVLVKRSSGADNWFVFDVMRGASYKTSNVLNPNTSSAESDISSFGNGVLIPNATGFSVIGSGFVTGTFIYMAIRRPMKPPTSGTQVFSPNTLTPSGATTVTTGFPVDLTISGVRNRSSSGITATYVNDRLRGGSTNQFVYVYTNLTSAEGNDPGYGFGMDNNTATIDNVYNTAAAVNTPCFYWNFRRAPGFFDVVCTSVFVDGTPITHNLGVTPELIFVKTRSSASNWMGAVNDAGNIRNLSINTTSGGYLPSLTYSSYFNATTIDPAGIYNGGGGSSKGNPVPVVIYLFASIAGVSKIGSYTGTGATQTINAALPTGARFVLIKRTDSTGDWFVWDTARGMVSGTDPRLALNSTAAELNNDWVLTTTNGFQIVTTDATVNASGGSYIYLAIA